MPVAQYRCTSHPQMITRRIACIEGGTYRRFVNMYLHQPQRSGKDRRLTHMRLPPAAWLFPILFSSRGYPRDMYGTSARHIAIRLRGGTMATYIMLVNWTDQGIRNVKDTVKRAKA